MASFPRKEQRSRCYAARDEYWKCLDENMPKGDTEAFKLCAQFKKLFEDQCPAQWVTHFVRKYDYLKFKEKINQGFDPIELDDKTQE